MNAQSQPVVMICATVAEAWVVASVTMCAFCESICPSDLSYQHQSQEHTVHGWP